MTLARTLLPSVFFFLLVKVTAALLPQNRKGQDRVPDDVLPHFSTFINVNLFLYYKWYYVISSVNNRIKYSISVVIQIKGLALVSEFPKHLVATCISHSCQNINFKFIQECNVLIGAIVYFRIFGNEIFKKVKNVRSGCPENVFPVRVQKEIWTIPGNKCRPGNIQ